MSAEPSISLIHGSGRQVGVGAGNCGPRAAMIGVPTGVTDMRRGMNTMASIHRVTTVMEESSGRRLEVRQNTQPSAGQRRLLRKMGTKIGLNRTLTSGSVLEMAPQK